MNLKKRVEAVVFSAGKYVSVEEIAKLCRKDLDSVKDVLKELKEDYDSRDSAIALMNEEDKWKLTVKERFIPTVRKIVAETELSKAVMQTLAYIAYKAPILQSDVVSVRSNKAYNHIADIESKGFITKTKHGHTFLINLTQKFYDYFDLKDKEDVQKRFGRVKEITAEDVLLRDVEKKWEAPELPEEPVIEKEKTETKKEEKEETKEKEEEEKKEKEEIEKTEDEFESQMDELKNKEKQEVIEKEAKKIEEHFNNLEKKENKKEKPENDASA
jgi:segregation and condensation protein B